MLKRLLAVAAIAATLALSGGGTHTAAAHPATVGYCQAVTITASLKVGHCGGTGYFSLSVACYSPKTGAFHHYAYGPRVAALYGGGSSPAECGSGYQAKHPTFHIY